MNLLSQWWTPDSSRRLAEIRECRDANESSGVFANVDYVDAPDRSKTYRELFSECVDRWPGQVCVVANTDIIFDESFRLIEPHIDDGTFAAITRWDSPASPRMVGHILHTPNGTRQMEYYDDFSFFSGSQDSWAFVANDKMRTAPNVPLGTQACDQVVVAWAAVEARFRVINPCLSVKTWHRHCTFDREPVGQDFLKGLYAYPQATTLDGVGDTMLAAHEWTERTVGKPLEWQVVRCQR